MGDYLQCYGQYGCTEMKCCSRRGQFVLTKWFTKWGNHGIMVYKHLRGKVMKGMCFVLTDRDSYPYDRGTIL